MRGNSIFLSAISDESGEVDSGYLGAWVVTLLVLGAIPVMCVGSLLAMWLLPEHRFDAQSLGAGVAAVCGGYGLAMGGIGVFRAGDKPKS